MRTAHNYPYTKKYGRLDWKLLSRFLKNSKILKNFENSNISELYS